MEENSDEPRFAPVMRTVVVDDIFESFWERCAEGRVKMSQQYRHRNMYRTSLLYTPIFDPRLVVIRPGTCHCLRLR
jgi:hypothetical protein